MYTKLLFLLAACTTLLFSCKKSESIEPDVNNIIGTWTFVNMTAHTTTTETHIVGGDSYKSVSIADYTTISNAGEMTINASLMEMRDFAYTAHFLAHVNLYLNDVLEDTVSFSIEFTAPLSSSSIPYEKIGNDSMYLSIGTVTTDGTTVPSTPGGLKYAWSGDTLLLTSTVEVPAGAAYVGYSRQTMRFIKKI